jgi:hypothetical protein
MHSRATAEHRRLEETRANGKKWRRWGTYLPERQWGTVREDYSANGEPWEYFPFDHAASRAYRWGDDGLLGLCDNRGLVCFCPALWNGADPILKERLFGLTGNEGNHGEDVKELYWYLDATPTASYARALYKYPQRAFPYDDLRARAAAATRSDPEPEIWQTGVFDEDRYFDVVVEYAKEDADDVLVRITVTNRGPARASLVVLPQLWLKNTWSWSLHSARPKLSAVAHGPAGVSTVELEEPHLGTYWFYVEGAHELLFTENDSNAVRLWGAPNATPYVKDAFHEAIVGGRRDAVSPSATGTKVGAHYPLDLARGESRTLRMRLTSASRPRPFDDHDRVFERRRKEADEFFGAIVPHNLDSGERLVFRQAVAGLLWSKQYYAYEVERWLRGDPAQPAPPADRRHGRNHQWRHLYNSEVLSMPDKWE